MGGKHSKQKSHYETPVQPKKKKKIKKKKNERPEIIVMREPITPTIVLPEIDDSKELPDRKAPTRPNNYIPAPCTQPQNSQYQDSTGQSQNVWTSTLPKIPQKQETRIIVKALYDYSACYEDGLDFSKDDRMEVFESSGDWWMATNIKTNKKGYIPSNYVVSDDDSVESQSWWFVFDRREAVKQLLLPGNPIGTFLIRSSTDSNAYALSILDRDHVADQFVIRHYKIRKMDDGRVFINTKKTFKSVLELVDYYSSSADSSLEGLKCHLTRPCPRQLLAIPFKELEVKQSEIQLGVLLGAGSFGQVYKGKFRDVIEVAVKVLKEGSMSVSDFVNEAKAMNKLRHKHLVQLLGVCTAVQPVYIITELMSNGALNTYLRSDGARDQILFPTLIDMAAQVAEGMSYLELNNYIHRDLRAANILVGDNNLVKVADFGLARLIEEIYVGENGVFQPEIPGEEKYPVKWTAPEAMLSLKFSIKSDVWAFGVLLHEIITYGGIPYPAIPNCDILDEVSNGYRIPQHPDCPDELYKIMSQCWCVEPLLRPTFQDLRNFLENFPVATDNLYYNLDC